MRHARYARRLVDKLARSLSEEGPGATFRKVLSNLANRHAPDAFDARYGVDTARVEPLWKFKIDSPNVYGRYQTRDEEEIVEALRLVGEDPRGFTFVDLGCGKGRAMIVAANLGYKQVVGVEFADGLVKIARTNLAKTRTSNAVVIHADAADFVFPDGDMVVYLYNPFPQEVLRKVVANLQKCRSSRLYVVYMMPEWTEVLDSSGFLRRFGSPEPGQCVQVWTAVPGTARERQPANI